MGSLFDRFYTLNGQGNRPDIDSEEESNKILAFDKWVVDFLSWIQQTCMNGAAREQLADIRDDSFTIASGLERIKSILRENLDLW